MAVSEINNLTIEKGASFTASFNLFNSDSSGLSISGITSTSAKIRKHPTSVIVENFSTTVTTAPPANIQIDLTPEQTSNLESGRNYFDIFITTSGNNRQKFITGTIIVNDSVT